MGVRHSAGDNQLKAHNYMRTPREEMNMTLSFHAATAMVSTSERILISYRVVPLYQNQGEMLGTLPCDRV